MELRLTVLILFGFMFFGKFFMLNSKSVPNCIYKARSCTERRLQAVVLHSDPSPVFQDALLHYCLNFLKCQKGKVEICSRVGRAESDYPDPILRRMLVKQCNEWKIPIKLAPQGDMTAHYVFYRLRANSSNLRTKNKNRF